MVTEQRAGWTANEEILSAYRETQRSDTLRIGRSFSLLLTLLLTISILLEQISIFMPHSLHLRLIPMGCAMIFYISSWYLAHNRPSLIIPAYTVFLASILIMLVGMSIYSCSFSRDSLGIDFEVYNGFAVSALLIYFFSGGAKKYIPYLFGSGVAALIVILLIFKPISSLLIQIILITSFYGFIFSWLAVKDAKAKRENFLARSIIKMKNTALAEENKEVQDLYKRLNRALGTQQSLQIRYKEGMEKFQTLFNLSPYPVFLESLHGKILECNPAAEKVYGYTRDELIGMSVEMLIPPKIREELPELLELEYRSVESQFLEVENIRKGGEIFAAEINVQLTEMNGEKLIMVVVHDLSGIVTRENKIRDLAKFPEQDPNPVLRMSREGGLLYSNQPAKDTFEIIEHENPFQAETVEKIRDIIQRGGISTFDIHFKGKIYSLSITPLSEEGYANIYCTEVSQKRNDEKRLHELSLALEESSSSVIITDSEGTITYVNKKFSDITGYSRQECLGRNPRFLKSGFQPDAFYKEMWDIISSGKEWHGEFANKTKFETIIWVAASINPLRDAEGQIFAYVGVQEDITAKQQHEEKLNFFALHDSMTNMPNRRAFFSLLKKTVSEGERYKSKFAIAFIDLDHFKPINDQYGHETGDTVLKMVSHRIKNSIREMDYAARFGGDEFVLLLKNVKNKTAVRNVVSRVKEEITQIMEIDSEKFQVGASIGISMFPADGTDGNVLVQQADKAMYRVKDAGKNDIAFI